MNATTKTLRVQRSFRQAQSVRALLDHPPQAIAVAVSGGPDSMALFFLLQNILTTDTQIHALTFDHDLRADSAAEAEQVGAWLADWPHVHHHILKWTGPKPDSAVMEGARDARYGKIARWCARNGVTQLWLGHHQTDQAETFLFRLAKGSGLDGLCLMSEYQPYADTDMMLVRPLLNLGKAEIEAFCDEKEIPYIRDPSNVNMKFARARLRQSLPVLEAEGLSEDRLAGTARRLGRAREALDFYTNKVMQKAVVCEAQQASIKMKALLDAPEEIRLRVIRHVLLAMEGGGYGPRLDRLESLLDDFFAGLAQGPGHAKRFTLGGYLFSYNRKEDAFLIVRQ